MMSFTTSARASSALLLALTGTMLCIGLPHHALAQQDSVFFQDGDSAHTPDLQEAAVDAGGMMYGDGPLLNLLSSSFPISGWQNPVPIASHLENFWVFRDSCGWLGNP